VEDFDDLVRRYRRELHVHCYRMLGSFDEAEEHVQEVFLRAWRSRECFQGRSSPRTWLYRVATNACLDTLRRDARRAVPASARSGAGPSVAALPWVQPYPDSLLDEMAAGQPGPEAVTVDRETISLAFLAAIQLLPPRQRAVLILRDVVSFPAAEVAGLLDMSVPAVTSALQRARTTLRDQWPDGRLDWAPAAEPDSGQRRLLQRYHGQRTAGHRRVPPPSRRDRVPPVRARRAALRRRPPCRHRRLRAAIDVHRVRPAGQPVTVGAYPCGIEWSQSASSVRSAATSATGWSSMMW
jgi:RNA polymerase sigma-70 factor (ECF subfamily)